MSKRPLEVAVSAARAGGRVLMSRFGNLRRAEIHRKGQSDWVTAVDHASEKAVLQVIRRAFPDHSIRAEESGFSRTESGWEWMVDPLDGTVNYMHGFPVFAVSIGVARDGILEAGVILDPVRKELFTAERGRGARLNGRRIRVSGRPGLKDAMLGTGFPFRAKEQLEVYLESFRSVFEVTGWVRRPGSAAMDLACTACGRMDGFWEMGLSSWDMAAGVLLIQEAGGIVTDFSGGKNYLRNGTIIAGTPGVQRPLLKRLSPIFRGRI